MLEVIDEVDTSGLGTLNLDEFKAIMQLTLGVKARIVGASNETVIRSLVRQFLLKSHRIHEWYIHPHEWLIL